MSRNRLGVSRMHLEATSFTADWRLLPGIGPGWELYSEKTAAEIRRRFPDVRNVSFNPMSLRAIFVAFAKAANEAA